MAVTACEVVLSEKEFRLYQALFADKLGIHLPDQKITLVGTRLWKRLRARGINSYTDYFNLINQSDQQEELCQALELITTNETYFFREPGHFDFLKHTVLPALKNKDVVRIWSAACSSGEELFSIAMVLADQRTGRWDLLGSDINQSMLEKARRAIYLDQRTEHMPAEYRRRFCRRGTGPHQGSLRNDADLRCRIKLQNIELHQPLPDVGVFDVVFLRNVMIYFDSDTRRRVVQNIVRQIHSGGYLFVGHSESLRGVCPELIQIQPAIYQVRKP